MVIDKSEMSDQSVPLLIDPEETYKVATKEGTVSTLVPGDKVAELARKAEKINQYYLAQRRAAGEDAMIID